jgi:quercetin 2,3-dioxygenase
MAARKVAKAWKSRPTIEGAGVYLKRAFGNQEVPELDPFLLLDDFRNTDPERYLPGFPWHPHRGIETITYVLDGEVDHGDSMGNSGTIGPGDIQWMTAGGGIIHQEMPRGNRKGIMGGFQLWANLPRSEKMMEPRYRGLTAAEIPEAKVPDGATVKVVAGKIGKTAGPVRDIVTDPEYLDVSVPAGATFTHAINDGHTVFAYVIEGAGYFDDQRSAYAHDVRPARWFDLEQECLFGRESLVLYERRGGDVTVTAGPASPGRSPTGVRFLLVSGRPIGEPVAWYGPIVMNTQAELRTAFEEYQAGTFIKHK